MDIIHSYETRFYSLKRTINIVCSPFVVRQINDQLMQIDRAFLDPAGLPNRRLKR